MKVTYQFTDADLTVYQKEAARATDMGKVYAFLFAFLALLFVMADMIVALVAIAKNDGSIFVAPIPNGILIRGAVGVGIGVVLGIAGALVSRVGNKKFAGKAGPNSVFCEHIIEIADDGFTEETHLNKYFMSWKGVEALNETASFLIIQVRLGLAHAIPKRAFKDPEEPGLFVTTVRSRIVAASVPGPDESFMSN